MIASPPGLGERADGFATGPAHDPARYLVATADVEGAVAGGEGLVYRARHVATGRDVALKLLTTTDSADFPRVAARAELLTDLGHRNLMTQIETFLGRPLSSEPLTGPEDFEEFDVPYSVSAWVDGRSLVESAATADVDEKLGWIADLAAALEHLHVRRSPATPDGLVHRDLKPSNIRIAADGRAVLVDFGVARAVDEADMTVGVGTYRWRAPEVLSGSAPIGAAADVWGLGAVAHWLLVGDPPCLDGAGAARERMLASLTAARRKRARAIARHVSKLLESSPDDRPCDLLAWRQSLAAASDRRGRFVPGFASSLGVLAVLTVVAGSQWGASAVPSPTISCSGGEIGGWSMTPSLRATPRDVSLGMQRGGARLACSASDKRSTDMQPIVVLSAAVRFHGLSCDITAPAPGPLAGEGYAVLAILDDPIPVTARLVVTPPMHGTSSIDLTIENGPWTGYEATVPMALTRTGSCDVDSGVSGYSSAELGRFTLRPT